MSLCVANLEGDSLVVDQVYKLYLLTIQEYDTQDYLIVFDMVYVNVILGRD